MRLLVCGSRSWTDRAKLFDVLDELTTSLAPRFAAPGRPMRRREMGPMSEQRDHSAGPREPEHQEPETPYGRLGRAWAETAKGRAATPREPETPPQNEALRAVERALAVLASPEHGPWVASGPWTGGSPYEPHWLVERPGGPGTGGTIAVVTVFGGGREAADAIAVLRNNVGAALREAAAAPGAALDDLAGYKVFFTAEDIRAAKIALGNPGDKAEGLMFICADVVAAILDRRSAGAAPDPQAEPEK